MSTLINPRHITAVREHTGDDGVWCTARLPDGSMWRISKTADEIFDTREPIPAEKLYGVI